MLNILEEIVVFKRTEISLRMTHYPESKWENTPEYVRKCFSLKEFLRKENASQIIAEFKRQSPSKGIINNKAGVVETTRGYAQAEASGISILTDKKFFGGSVQDLQISRAGLEVPILQKDFILTTYQITEAKGAGADVILLIAAILTEGQIRELSRFAQELGMEVICEVHNEKELQKALVPTVDIIGVNNRDLRTFRTNLEIAKNLANKIPSEFLKIAESGIEKVEDIVMLREFGYEGFLIGESFMQNEKPSAVLAEWVQNLPPLPKKAITQSSDIRMEESKQTSQNEQN